MVYSSSASVLSGRTVVEYAPVSDEAITSLNANSTSTQSSEQKESSTGSLRQRLGNLLLHRQSKRPQSNPTVDSSKKTGNSARPGLRYSLALSSLQETSLPDAYLVF
ncbi:hypothetical protein FB639_000438 [Coemansia asiatica]|nr:hypothetical protein FB639_000438 [Coemansia asiatica]